MKAQFNLTLTDIFHIFHTQDLGEWHTEFHYLKKNYCGFQVELFFYNILQNH